MENSTTTDNISDIPPAQEFTSKEVDESSYDFQLKKVLEKIKSISKSTPTITLLFKSMVNETLVEKIVAQGYTVKIDSYYDSSKEDNKYNSKMRISNPSFNNGNTAFIDRIEDQLKNCAFSQSSFQVPEETKSFIESMLGGFKL